MTREINLIDHLPPVYQSPEEMQEIMRVETPYINSLWVNTENIYNDAFILTSTDYGLNRRFEFLNMPIDPNDDRETKIFKLLARYQEQAPYTWRSLHRLLDSLLGVGAYGLTRDVANKTIEVRLELTQAAQYEAVIDLLERVVPQDMIILVQLRYNTYNQLSPFTHNQLALKTHDELREDDL